MMVRKYYGIILGVLFSVLSVALAYTYIIPIVTVMPLTLIFEGVSPKGMEGEVSLISNALLFIIILVVLIWRGVKYRITISQMRLFFLVEWFVVHTLGFDVCWGISNGFRSDGQLIMLSIGSAIYSSFVFIPLGLLKFYFRGR